MLTIPLLGVVNDGRAFAPAVPKYNAQQIELPLGVLASITVEVVYPDGTPAALAGTYVLTVKRSPMALTTPLGFALSGTRVNNRVTFALPAASTSAMLARRYLYDVWHTTGSDRTCLIPVSPFVLLPTISRA